MAGTPGPGPTGADDPERLRLLDLAVRDNARWCDLLTRTHGARGTTDADAWTSPTRTPPGYPDAVVLRRGVDSTALLSRVDTSTAGCSVKDSYADLDLSAYGFRELFSATWIGRAWTARPPSPAAGWHRVDRATGWQRVDRATLAAWETAWAGAPPSDPLFRPELLEAPGLTVLAAWRGGEVVAGCVLTAGDAAVGVSNLFVREGRPRTAWQHVLDWIAAHHPGVPVVGYETGDDLTAAVDAGLSPLGPLRVWIA